MKDIFQKTLTVFSAFALVLSAAFCTAFPAFAEYLPEPGSIEVSLADLGTTNYAVSTITGYLYKIGDTDIYGRSSIYEDYGGGEMPETATDIQALIDYLEVNIREEDLVMTEKSVDGVILFENLDMGVYFATFSPSEKYGTVTPILINLPFWEDDDGLVTGPFWDAKAEPKSVPYVGPDMASPYYGSGTSSERPATATYRGDTPSDKNRGTAQLGGIEMDDFQSDETNPGGTTVTPGNTGETIPIWVYVLLFAAAIGAVGIVVLERRRGDE